jgi:hypothetical protein
MPTLLASQNDVILTVLSSQQRSRPDSAVIPAQAGIHRGERLPCTMDPGLRRDDGSFDDGSFDDGSFDGGHLMAAI